ncbi:MULTISPECIES: ABC transporter substrate-binding protein [Halorussus]|uniref:ABC transporter substrate-binding protein n=1 Tax=Halorussus TaxID=1070314 RepID=UPI00209DD747|nr:ABC transporter substrate-binding protein [Halorussus vallis]USZ75037.1 ABC transporter substrate-binding protein [Halorussus vallis]
MDVREFPVLSDDDGRLVDRLAVGLGEDLGRVLAYLLLRAERERDADAHASRLAVRVGTELSRNAVTDALSRLQERDFVNTTTVRDETRGRPPRAWYVSCDRETAVERVYGGHADALLDRARAVFDVADEPGGDAGADADGGREVTVGLNWAPNGLHLPLFAAAGRGEYADRGVSVDFERNDGSSAAVEAVSSGAADVGVAGATSVLRARQQGRKVVPIAVPFQRAMAVLYAERDRFGTSFKSVQQLRGRRIGMPVESEVGLLARLFLSQSGVLSDVELVDVAGEERDALRSGRVDVVTGSFSDPRELREEGVRVDSLLVADRFPIYGSCLIAPEEALRRRREPLADFLAATTAGWAEAVRRPYEVHAVGGADSASERRTFELAADEFGSSDAVRRRGWGWQDPETWRRLETALAVADIDG